MDELEDRNEIVDENHIPIDFGDYHKTIYAKGMQGDLIDELLESHSEIVEEFYSPDAYSIGRMADNPSVAVIRCPEYIGFHEFHNLVGWFNSAIEHDIKDIYGIATSIVDPLKSYYVCLESENADIDTLVGKMDDGTPFSIYIPDSYVEKGNIIKGENELTVVGYQKILDGL